MEKTTVTMHDDLDPTGDTLADERIRFTWDGEVREIDLCKENAQGFREAMHRYVQASRVVAVKPKGASRTARRKDSATTRRWLKEVAHHSVPERGRIPAHLVQEYVDAGSPTSW